MDSDRVCLSPGGSRVAAGALRSPPANASTMDCHPAGDCPSRGCMDGSFLSMVSSATLRFYSARLAHRAFVPGALLADRPILSGSESPYRKATAGVRPL